MRVMSASLLAGEQDAQQLGEEKTKTPLR